MATEGHIALVNRSLRTIRTVSPSVLALQLSDRSPNNAMPSRNSNFSQTPQSFRLSNFLQSFLNSRHRLNFTLRYKPVH